MRSQAGPRGKKEITCRERACVRLHRGRRRLMSTLCARVEPSRRRFLGARRRKIILFFPPLRDFWAYQAHVRADVPTELLRRAVGIGSRCAVASGCYTTGARAHARGGPVRCEGRAPLPRAAVSSSPVWGVNYSFVIRSFLCHAPRAAPHLI